MNKRFLVVFLLLISFQSAFAHAEPTSMFDILMDPGFWFFFLANILTWLFFAFIFIKLFGTCKQSRAIEKEWGFALVVFFLFALGYQVFHQMEHIAQFYQYHFMKLPESDSAGILWFLDLEWNHFIFNTGYFVALVIICCSIMNKFKKKHEKLCPMSKFLIGGSLLVQGWHFIEHSVRITRHIFTGCEPCAGVLDTIFGWGLINLHFVLNSIVMVLPLAMFFWFGFHRRTKKICGLK